MSADAILLVEDNDDDAFFMQQALHDSQIVNPVHRVENGREAIEYLAGDGRFADREKYPLPLIVFLDLKLPEKSGHQVLQWIRAQPRFAPMRVVVLTSSNEPVDLNRSYQLGANSFMVKPARADELAGLAEFFKFQWTRRTAD